MPISPPQLDSAATDGPPRSVAALLARMAATYRKDPVKAVRGQAFIKPLHQYLGHDLDGRLTDFARNRGIKVRYEATILGSTKPKDVDVAVVDPDNGPLMLIGVRSQMSSVGKNVLEYYQGIVGEAVSLQERFPLTTLGYVYLHPWRSIKQDREREPIDHQRYARMYAAVSGRSGRDYKNVRGVFDEFAYMIVDFNRDPPLLRDDDMTHWGLDVDLSLGTFLDRMVAKFNSRLVFWDIFV